MKLLIFFCACASALTNIRRTPQVFHAEDLEHPFSALSRYLCMLDDSIGVHGARAVRQALLALSLQSKAAKGLDGLTHGISSIGASAASGATVAEKLAAARDAKKSTHLRSRANAAAKALAVMDALEAIEFIQKPPTNVSVIDDLLTVDVVEGEVTTVILRWIGDEGDLFEALNSDVARHPSFLAASHAFLRLAENARLLVPEAEKLLVLGHGVAGSVAALLAGLLADDNSDVRAVCIGPAPCASRRHFRGIARCTSLVLGDDLIPRTSRNSLRRLRRRLRRCLPTKGQSRLGIFGMSAAVASTALASIAGERKAHIVDETTETDDIQLHLPGHLFFLKPRKDASVSLYALKSETPKQGARADLLWQLDDILLSKSMLAHHTLDAYLESLDRA